MTEYETALVEKDDSEEVLLPDGIGIALSGGGVRAALFSAGAMLYLVHARINERVKLISSVSGGSITNAVIAMNGDFSQSDPAGFTRLMSRMCHRMSKKGVFFWPGWRFAAALIPLALWAPVVNGASILVGETDRWDWRFLWLGGAFFIGAMTLYFLGYLLIGRRGIQQGAYEQFLKSVHPVDRGGRSDGVKATFPKKLGELPESSVAHILCATELTSGQPLFMSRDRVFSPVFGHGKPELTIVQAMYASAAFPGAFPPLRLKSNNVDMSGGVEDDPPKSLFLADGGVFNNLGTDAFLAASQPQSTFVPDPDVEMQLSEPVQRNLIINVSSPPRTRKISRVPGWHTFKNISRTMSVMYESTLRPRVQRLMEQECDPAGPIVVDVAQSPLELTDRIIANREADDRVARRAAASRDKLINHFKVQGVLDVQATAREAWKARADDAAQTKTVLTAVGRTAASRLVSLGYLQAAIACHAHFVSPGFEMVPSDAWFKAFLDDQLSEDQITQAIGSNVRQDA